MQNVYVVSKPQFPVLSNGVIVPALRLILCTGKWIQLFTETALEFNAFSAYRKTKPSIRKSIKFWYRNNINILHLLCILVATCFLSLKDTGIHTTRYAWLRYKLQIQTNHNIQNMLRLDTYLESMSVQFGQVHATLRSLVLGLSISVLIVVTVPPLGRVVTTRGDELLITCHLVGSRGSCWICCPPFVLCVELMIGSTSSKEIE
jgi:hypothetical protein